MCARTTEQVGQGGAPGRRGLTQRACVRSRARTRTRRRPPPRACARVVVVAHAARVCVRVCVRAARARRRRTWCSSTVLPAPEGPTRTTVSRCLAPPPPAAARPDAPRAPRRVANQASASSSSSTAAAAKSGGCDSSDEAWPGGAPSVAAIVAFVCRTRGHRRSRTSPNHDDRSTRNSRRGGEERP